MKKPQLLDDTAMEQVTGGAAPALYAGLNEGADTDSGIAMSAGADKKTIKEYKEYIIFPDIGTI